MSAPARYYPQHFRGTRPYAHALEDKFAEAVVADRVNPRDSYNLAADQVLLAYGKEGVRFNSPAFSLQAFSQEISTALTYAQWRHDGSNTFDFEPGLCEAFLHSDVDDLRLSSLVFPFNSFYFHFGPQDELPLYGSELHAEGAFLIHHPGISLRIVLAARYPEHTPWLARARECYQLNLAARHFGTDLGTAIDSALADDLEDLRKVSTGLPADERERMQAKALDFIEAHQQNMGTFRKAVRLVVNGLSYLTAYPEDAAQSWQKGTPEKLLHKARQGGSPKERDRAVSKLVSQGFLPVRRVGQAFQREVEASGAGAQRKAHWRRGHWRHQVHGTGRSLRKLVWIQPMRILGGDGNVDHVFKVISGDARS